MDKKLPKTELQRLMKRLMRAQQSGNETKIQDALNDSKTYLEPFLKEFFLLSHPKIASLWSPTKSIILEP